MRHLSWIVTLPFGLLVLLFALSNRGPVELELWPLPDRIEAPVYLIGLAGALLGFLIGGMIAFAGGGPARRRARDLARRVERLEAALDEAERAARLPPGDSAGRAADGRLAIGGGRR